MRYAIVMLLMLVGTTFGQTIYVQHDGTDSVGTRFAYAVKEKLRKSTKYTVVDSEAESKILLSLVTVDVNTGTSQQLPQGYESAISVLVMGSGPILLYHGVLAVGKDRIEDEADEIIADLDESVGPVRNLLNKN